MRQDETKWRNADCTDCRPYSSLVSATVRRATGFRGGLLRCTDGVCGIRLTSSFAALSENMRPIRRQIGQYVGQGTIRRQPMTRTPCPTRQTFGDSDKKPLDLHQPSRPELRNYRRNPLAAGPEAATRMAPACQARLTCARGRVSLSAAVNQDLDALPSQTFFWIRSETRPGRGVGWLQLLLRPISPSPFASACTPLLPWPLSWPET